MGYVEAELFGRDNREPAAILLALNVIPLQGGHLTHSAIERLVSYKLISG